MHRTSAHVGSVPVAKDMRLLARCKPCEQQQRSRFHQAHLACRLYHRWVLSLWGGRPPGLTQVFLSGIAMAADAAWRDADRDIIRQQQAEAAEAAEQERAAAAAARQAAEHQQASQLFGQQWADYYARLTAHQAAVTAYRAARGTSMSCESSADEGGSGLE